MTHFWQGAENDEMKICITASEISNAESRVSAGSAHSINAASRISAAYQSHAGPRWVALSRAEDLHREISAEESAQASQRREISTSLKAAPGPTENRTRRRWKSMRKGQLKSPFSRPRQSTLNSAEIQRISSRLRWVSAYLLKTALRISAPLHDCDWEGRGFKSPSQACAEAGTQREGDRKGGDQLIVPRLQWQWEQTSNAAAKLSNVVPGVSASLQGCITGFWCRVELKRYAHSRRWIESLRWSTLTFIILSLTALKNQCNFLPSQSLATLSTLSTLTAAEGFCKSSGESPGRLF